MASNENLLKRFLLKKRIPNLNNPIQKKTNHDLGKCILCDDKLDLEYENCTNCRGPGSRITAKKLKKLWNVQCSHQLYSRDGDWYHVLDYFPGALFDKKGFVIFETEEEFNRCPHLSINKVASKGKGIVNIKGNYSNNISKIKGYRYMVFINGKWILKE